MAAKKLPRLIMIRGRPSHTYHAYMIANLRLVLEVEVQAGTDTSASYSSPGLWELLDRIPRPLWPQYIRGDSDWGTEDVMAMAEDKEVDYLFNTSRSCYTSTIASMARKQKIPN
ncbi:MAG: hypothetical protein ACI9Y1_002170 [Lentisphaeria bacterium]|jgi:hypothetical protein